MSTNIGISIAMVEVPPAPASGGAPPQQVIPCTPISHGYVAQKKKNETKTQLISLWQSIWVVSKTAARW